MNKYLSIFKEFKNEDRKNKENRLDFKKTLNIMMLSNNSSKNIAEVNIIHKILHELPKEVGVLKCVKDLISKNIDLLPKEIYAHLMKNEKYNYIKILEGNLLVQVITFEIRLFQMLIENNILIKEFEINATYNTNNLGFELYFIHAEVDETRFSLAYLFLKNNKKYDDSIKTEIITKFVLQLKEKGLNSKFILMDKNWL
ncbi:hypothetical protein C1645_822564 [Glomus cerebriforme]|uniref:MULE transposase domain-containing protein n=1 Tax=Glomus cerebriforme TaxID=658196 RepID=A0A397SXZ7_9GLOM|nr:hypothetical protein C1645_822564 [Glomus cerebriforme]